MRLVVIFAIMVTHLTMTPTQRSRVLEEIVLLTVQSPTK